MSFFKYGNALVFVLKKMLVALHCIENILGTTVNDFVVNELGKLTML